jgi:nucleoside-diphosphate-sugar epimerase
VKILVTGCAGYIGSRLVGHLLGAGCEVVGLDNLYYDTGRSLLGHLGRPRFSFIQGDVLDPQTVKGAARDCDAAVHLAALVGAPICEKRHEYAKEVNTRSVEVLVKCLTADQRLILPATNSGYGQKKEGFCTETDELRPVSTYGVTKGEGEKIALSHPDAVSLRLATVFGPSPRMRFDLMVNDFVRRLYTQGSLSIFQPHFRRNFVHIDDVCRAVLFMLQNHEHSGVFNCGHPEANLTKWELAHTIRKELGLKYAVVTEGTGEDKDKRDYLVSNEKLLSTGFTFKHPLREGIRQVIEVCSLLSPVEAAGSGNFA